MRKDERGASTRPDARMTCEGDTSKVEVRTLPVRGLAVTERPQRNLISKPTCLYRDLQGARPLRLQRAHFTKPFRFGSAPHNRIIDMNELLELKHRIDNCTDDLQSFELRKIYDKLIIDLWQSEKLLCQKCSLWLSSPVTEGAECARTDII